MNPGVGLYCRLEPADDSVVSRVADSLFAKAIGETRM
jgi:hypothetical protein